MFHKNIKLVLAVLTFAWSVYEFTQGHIGNGIAILLLVGMFVLLYFKNEFILLAFLQLRRQNFPRAQKWLGYIKSPEAALTKKQQGYYNYLQGIMIARVNMTQAEKYFKKAIRLGLAMKTDLAMAKLQLANIAANKRRKREATMLLNEAKKLDKHGMLKEQIQMLKQQMKRI